MQSGVYVFYCGLNCNALSDVCCVLRACTYQVITAHRAINSQTAAVSEPSASDDEERKYDHVYLKCTDIDFTYYHRKSHKVAVIGNYHQMGSFLW